MTLPKLVKGLTLGVALLVAAAPAAIGAERACHGEYGGGCEWIFIEAWMNPGHGTMIVICDGELISETEGLGSCTGYPSFN